MGKWFRRKGSQGLGLKPGQWVEIHSCCWLYFYKQTDYQIWYLCRPFQWNNLQKFKYSEGGGGGHVEASNWPMNISGELRANNIFKPTHLFLS